MALTCGDILSRMGFVCTPLSEDVVAVCTPINLPDNTPVYMYAKRHGDTLELTDDGDILMHLHGIGLFDNNRLPSSIERRVVKHGGAFESGKVVIRTTKDRLQEGFASYLRALVEIIDYELELTAVGNETASIIGAVVDSIRRRNAGVHIEHDVSVTGSSGATYRFPLRANSRLIDSISPHHQSTGSALRKSADLEKIGITPPLIIIDDREDRIAAEREASIISALASTMLFSTLLHGSEPLNLGSAVH